MGLYPGGLITGMKNLFQIWWAYNRGGGGEGDYNRDFTGFFSIIIESKTKFLECRPFEKRFKFFIWTMRAEFKFLWNSHSRMQLYIPWVFYILKCTLSSLGVRIREILLYFRD